MAKLHRTLLLSLVWVSLVLGIGLPNSNVWGAEPAGNPIVIENVDYSIDNIHPGFWGGKFNPNTPRLVIAFYIYIKDLANCLGNIKDIKVYDANGLAPWAIPLQDNVDENMQFIGGGTNFYDETLSNNGTVLCLKDYRVEVQTKDGVKVAKTFTVYEPGKHEDTAKKYVYSEDYRGQKNDSYVEALQWGKIVSAVYQKGTFEVQFTVNDSRTANVKMQFLDKDKNYLGETRWLVNSFSKEVFASLNDGEQFYCDGQPNQVEIENNEILVQKSKNITKTKFVVLITKDGNQYSDAKDPSDFNFRAYSEPFELKN